MKILYLADARDIHTYRLIKYFADKNHEVHVASFERSDDIENLENVYVHLLKRSKNLEYSLLSTITLWISKKMHIGATIFNPLFAIKQVKKLIQEINPDVLHGQSIIHHTMIGAFAGFHPFVVTAIGNDVLIYPKQSIIVKYAVKYTLNKADLIVCDGINLKNAMAKMGIESQKIHIILYGVDTKKFCPPKGTKILNTNTVISTRRMGKVHDIETFIRAIPLIMKEIPDVRILVIGDGEQKDYLNNLAESLHIMNNIEFVGMVSHDELPKYLSSSNVYVSTSTSDGGMAVSNVEAMACGLPLIMTDVGDCRKWIKDGENGFVIPIKNPKTLAEKIIYLLKNENVGTRMGEINRRIVEEKSNYYKEMEKMEQTYVKLLKRNIT